MDEEGDVLDARQAALYLGLHEETVRRLAREEKIPAYKVGGVWRFSRSFLYRWATSQQARRKTSCVLVVDDEEAVRDVLRRTLELAEFKVTAASGGVEALEFLHRDDPDLVLLDLKMPGMDGPATLKEIRRARGPIPVIILTGYPDSDLMARAMEYSPIMLLGKPAEPRQILQAVRMVMGGSDTGLKDEPTNASAPG